MKDIDKIKNRRSKEKEVLLDGNKKVDSVNERITDFVDQIETLQSSGTTSAKKRDNELSKLRDEKKDHFNQITRKWGRFVASENKELLFNDVSSIYQFLEYLSENQEEPKKYKVALLFICLNEQYWEFAKDAVEGAKKYFLPGHDVDYFLWTDMKKEMTEYHLDKDASERAYNSVQYAFEHMNIIPTDAVVWPYPTLMRYHLFLQREETLKEYDYVFYCDIDMRWNDIVGDEILGEKLTVAPHPMYWARKGILSPTEPNELSAAYIKREGFVTETNGKKEFTHVYGAGGFQGGKTEYFIKAMKEMKKSIDEDFKINYIAIWNDESHWNKYLFQHPDEISIYLTPAYVYPDSLINEYYTKIWGRDFHPRLITITKKFTTSKEAGQHISNELKTW